MQQNQQTLADQWSQYSSNLTPNQQFYLDSQALNGGQGNQFTPAQMQQLLMQQQSHQQHAPQQQMAAAQSQASEVYFPPGFPSMDSYGATASSQPGSAPNSASGRDRFESRDRFDNRDRNQQQQRGNDRGFRQGGQRGGGRDRPHPYGRSNDGPRPNRPTPGSAEAMAGEYRGGGKLEFAENTYNSGNF